MKFAVLTITLFIYVSSIAQISVNDGLGFKIPAPKNFHSYSLYWYPFFRYDGDTFHVKKVLIRKAEFENALEKKVTKSFDSEITSTEESFYKDSLLIKYIRKFPGSKIEEIYYYKYNPVTNELMSAKGYQKGKLIFSEEQKRIKDTLVTKSFSDWNFLLTKGKRLVYFSNDSLMQTNILFRDCKSQPEYLIKKFNAKHLVIEEIDSSKGKFGMTKYAYDSLGRLTEIKEIEDSVLRSITEYKYGNIQTLIFTYRVYDKSNMKQLGKQELQQFDKNSLLYDETINYDKGEESITVGTIIKKFYNNSRLMKVEVYSDKKKMNVYEINYE
ncbi:MAG TPA: hypothetical protein VKT28_00800 [Puia sp.]|nr:hypothetical protein [Puia sp.]